MAVGSPQIQQRIPFVDRDGRLTNEGLRVLNDSFKEQFSLIVQVAQLAGVDLPALDAAISAAQTAADNANAAAAAAQAAQDATQKASDLANSYIDNPAPITVSDAGSSVTITIAAHNRIYGDGASVAVSGDVLTGFPYDTGQYIFYDDPARTGGTVSYAASIDPLDAAQLGDRHSVGFAPPLAALDPDANGGGVRPPGGSYYEPF